MSDAVLKQKAGNKPNKPRKQRKKKRSASSPLNESSRPDKLTGVNFNGANNNSNYNSTNQENNENSTFNINHQCWKYASDGFYFENSLPNMSFSQPPAQFGGFSFPNQNSYSAPIQLSTSVVVNPRVLHWI